MLPLLFLLLVGQLSASSTYTVKASGGSFATIQECATVAIEGDTCIVDPGTYDERVTPAHSGTAGNPITFQAANSTKPKVRGWTLTSRAYITVTGFEVTHSGMTADGEASIYVNMTDHVRVDNNYIHDTNTIAVRGSVNVSDTRSTYLYVGGNTIAYCGPPNSGPPNYTGGRMPALNLWGDNALIEGNDISHCSDFTRTQGDYVVVRNNNWHDALVSDTYGYTGSAGSGEHIDGWQSGCVAGMQAANYTLLEGNYMHEVPQSDSHFGLINDTISCSGTTTVIVRGNVSYRVGSGFYGADTANQGPATFHKIYNNTVHAMLLPAGEASTGTNGVTGATVLNNIFSNASLDSGSYSGYLLKSGDGTSGGDYNLGYFSSGSKTWAAPIGTEPHRVLNADPRFAGTADFHLQSTSPAIGAGGPLTSVAIADTGSGTSLVVADAHFFQPGWAGTQADWIKVGASTAQIASINYATNTVTLANSIARSVGDPVYLYKDSSGGAVLTGTNPDIGAYPYAATTGNGAPPTKVKIKIK